MMRSSAITLALLAGMISACWVHTEQGERMERDIATLRRQLVSVRRAQEEGHVRLLSRVNMLSKRGKELSEQLSTLDKSAHRGATDVGVELSDLTRAFTRLPGDIEMQGFRLERMESDVKAITNPDASDTAAAMGGRKPDSGTTANQDKAATAKSRPPLGKRELLDTAKKALSAKQYDKALKLYSRAGRKWPREAGVADRAAMGAGLALAGKGDHRRAIIEYNRILERFPRSSYVDDALFEIAQAFIALGYPDDARAFIEELVTRHPSSALRTRASKQLKDLKKKRKK